MGVGPGSVGNYDDRLNDDLQRFVFVDLTEGTASGPPGPVVGNNRFAVPCDDCVKNPAYGPFGTFLVRPVAVPDSSSTLALLAIALLGLVLLPRLVSSAKPS